MNIYYYYSLIIIYNICSCYYFIFLKVNFTYFYIRDLLTGKICFSFLSFVVLGSRNILCGVFLKFWFLDRICKYFVTYMYVHNKGFCHVNSIVLNQNFI